MAKTLDSGEVSAFCEGIAMMLSAGIQTEEALVLLSENMEAGPFKDVCEHVYRDLVGGKHLFEAMRQSNAFPTYAIEMVQAGERSGRLDNVLLSLAQYYAEEDRLFAKMHSAVVYPAALLTVMMVILFFTLVVILPLFVDVYESIAGNLAAGAFSYVNISIIVGWVAFFIMAACAIAVFAALVMSRGVNGQARLMRLFEKLPATRDAMYQLALSRFTSALATFISTGMNTDLAMEQAYEMVDHRVLSLKVGRAYADMIDLSAPKSLAQAIHTNDIFDPIHSRMMMIGNRSGALERVLQRLSTSFFDDAIMRIDGTIDSVEPALAAFLTVSVGVTLIAVMLPLIGIMGSIG